MAIGSNSTRKFLTLGLAVACLTLVVAWPTWRTVLAQQGYYEPDTSALLGCSEPRTVNELQVTLVQGEDVGATIGSSCTDALNLYLAADCTVIEGKHFATTRSRHSLGPKFSALYLLGCRG